VAMTERKEGKHGKKGSDKTRKELQGHGDPGRQFQGHGDPGRQLQPDADARDHGQLHKDGDAGEQAGPGHRQERGTADRGADRHPAHDEMRCGMNRIWWKAAGIRALKTLAQTAIATIGTSAVISEVNWGVVASASVLAALLSLLTSVAGLPEVDMREDLEDWDE